MGTDDFAGENHGKECQKSGCSSFRMKICEVGMNWDCLAYKMRDDIWPDTHLRILNFTHLRILTHLRIHHKNFTHLRIHLGGLGWG